MKTVDINSKNEGENILIIFPEKLLKVELEQDYSIVHDLLKQDTDFTTNFTSTHTNKKFRGIVTSEDFKVISSEIGKGAVCVFKGTFNEKSGTISIRINKGFQILFGILLSYPFIGFGLILYLQGIDIALQYLPILLITLLAIRFLFIELSFKFISRTGIKKLTKTLKIKVINGRLV